MKKTTIKTRIIAGVLAVITAVSVAAFGTVSTSAAEVDAAAENTQKIEAVLKIGNEEKSCNSFMDAWDQAVAAKEATVKMASHDLYHLSNLVVPAGVKLTVDLGGGNIWTESELFKVEKGGDCTISNGVIYLAKTAVIANGNVNIYNLTVDTAKDSAVKGGEGAKVVIDGCRFISNIGNQGGAVYLPYHTEGTIVKNSVFERNGATREGAAIYTHNPVSNCTFRNNSSRTDGGAVYMAGNNESISDCTFEENYASGNGGAIAVSQDMTHINTCTFRQNQAYKNGGAIFVPDGKDVDVKGCNFTFNTSLENGGAIFIGYRSFLRLENSELTRNGANRKGGAIYLGALMSMNHMFNNVVITDNSAFGAGGGVYAATDGMASADVNVFGKNIVKNNSNNDFYLEDGQYKKAMIYTRYGFDAKESEVYINSSRDGEIAVVDLYEKTDEIAFRANAGRSLSRGFFFNETLYIK